MRRSSSGVVNDEIDHAEDDRGADEREGALVAVGDHDEDGTARLHDEAAEAEHRAEQHHEQGRVPNSVDKSWRMREAGRMPPAVSPLPREEEREQEHAHAEDRGDEHGERPAGARGLGAEAQQLGQPRHAERRESERDRPEGPHHADDAGARGRIDEGRADEPPERHVADRVGEAPQHVEDAEVDELARLVDVGNREQQPREHRDGRRREQDVRPQLAPPGAGHVDDAAHHRVEDRVDDLRHRDDHRDDREARRC